MKIFYFDVETTGLNCYKHAIIQLAGLIEIDGEIRKTFNYKVKPWQDSIIDDKALEVSGVTREELDTYDDPNKVYWDLVNELGLHVNKYDKNDKFYPAGFNVNFDLGFLRQFFAANGDNYFGSWFNYRYIDPLPLFYMLDMNGSMNLENYKLETIANHLGIEIKAHDALSDINATREVVSYALNQLKAPTIK